MHRILKPWFVYRPTQILRRMFCSIGPAGESSELGTLKTSWGGRLILARNKDIGKSIARTGVYDLAVTEAFARLVDPGNTVVDVGANIGYTTQLAALLAGPRGKVVSFEPHPELFQLLRRNCEPLLKRSCTPDLHQLALGQETGVGSLSIGESFSHNDGTSHIVSVPDKNSIPVDIRSLDSIARELDISLLKIDVEGGEFAVLQGAELTLAAGRIRHILFEDHTWQDSPVFSLLARHGYQICSIGWTLRGPVAGNLQSGLLSKVYEAPNFVASLDLADVYRRFSPRGWRSLRNITPA
ncbi:MAG: FkbM family methyltransferase [Planctomycetaceae bacterium]|nr:FkbM family methyltransferase [Planctomycetaceae bacterium]